MEEKAEAVRLPLQSGMLADVLTMDNELSFTGRVAEYDGTTVTIRDSRGRDLPVGVYGKQVKLRFERSDENLMVHGKICRSSPDCWAVDQLEQQFTAPKRAFFRQRIEVKAEVTCVRRGPIDSQLRRGVGWSDCTVVDVSASGLRLTSREPFCEGDLLSIRSVRLAERLPPFSFSCHVRRAVRGDDGSTLCGCQIEPLPAKDQAQLEEAIFILQREEIQRKRERGT